MRSRHSAPRRATSAPRRSATAGWAARPRRGSAMSAGVCAGALVAIGARPDEAQDALHDAFEKAPARNEHFSRPGGLAVRRRVAALATTSRSRGDLQPSPRVLWSRTPTGRSSEHRGRLAARLMFFPGRLSHARFARRAVSIRAWIIRQAASPDLFRFKEEVRGSNPLRATSRELPNQLRDFESEWHLPCQAQPFLSA